jgi:hypothetical protein
MHTFADVADALVLTHPLPVPPPRDWLLYLDPELAFAAAAILERMTGNYSLVVRYGEGFRITPYDCEGKKIEE